MMKVTDLLKRKEKKEIQEDTPVIIPLKAGQTYKDLIYEELGGRVREIKAEIEKLNEEFDRISDALEKQGHLNKNAKDKDRFGHETVKAVWTDKAEAIYAPRRRKAENLNLRLEGAEQYFKAKTYELLSMAETLDNIEYIKYREDIYNIAASKVYELIPIMEKVKSCNFDVSYKGEYNTNLSDKFMDFVSAFQSQAPGSIDEATLKIKFYKKFEKVRAELEKEKEIEDLKKFEVKDIV